MQGDEGRHVGAPPLVRQEFGRGRPLAGVLAGLDHVTEGVPTTAACALARRR